jgi:hypothetical protein
MRPVGNGHEAKQQINLGRLPKKKEEKETISTYETRRKYA